MRGYYHEVKQRLNLFKWKDKEQFTKESLLNDINKYEKIIKALLRKIKATKGQRGQKFYINKYKEYKCTLGSLHALLEGSN